MIHVVVFDVKVVNIRNLVIVEDVLRQTEYRFTVHARWHHAVKVKDLYIVENVRRFLVNFCVNILVIRSMGTILRERELNNVKNGQRAYDKSEKKGNRIVVAENEI